MALPTKFITNKSPYSNQDLNTIFAPIAVNQIDYGIFSGLNIKTDWAKPKPTRLQTTANNIKLFSNGFEVLSAGFYRLNITLNFSATPSSTVKNLVFILSNSSTAPASNGYNFTPSPKMSTIYAINCSGASGYNGDATNYLNNANLGNCLSLNPVQTANEGTDPFSTNPYFFSFPVFCNGTPSSNTNFFTLDITFKATVNQAIYLHIRCRNTGEEITLQNSNWIFTKINEIPS